MILISGYTNYFKSWMHVWPRPISSNFKKRRRSLQFLSNENKVSKFLWPFYVLRLHLLLLLSFGSSRATPTKTLGFKRPMNVGCLWAISELSSRNWVSFSYCSPKDCQEFNTSTSPNPGNASFLNTVEINSKFSKKAPFGTPGFFEVRNIKRKGNDWSKGVHWIGLIAMQIQRKPVKLMAATNQSPILP